ncbi:MAG TPA: hypothetical protein VFK40_02755 [Nitrososphaeraceae archaeon]|nr:hypothetical protein [Nitrososphaeraceae archaeon]
MSFLDLSDENKDYIAKVIIKGTIELMQSTLARETPKIVLIDSQNRNLNLKMQ